MLGFVIGLELALNAKLDKPVGLQLALNAKLNKPVFDLRRFLDVFDLVLEFDFVFDIAFKFNKFNIAFEFNKVDIALEFDKFDIELE